MTRLRLRTRVDTEDLDPVVPSVIARDGGGRITSVEMTHVSVIVTKTFTWDPIATEITSAVRTIVDVV